MVNALEDIKNGKLPYSLRSGFFIFLESERMRHLEDARKIEKMQIELIEMTPLFTKEVIDSFKKFSKRFTEFEL